VTLVTPWMMQKPDPGDPDIEYTSQMVRRYTTWSLWDEGVLDLSAFAVSERGAGANFTVDVTGGFAVVEGDDQASQGSYMVESTGTENIAVTAAPGSNSRLDLVVLQVNDPQAGGGAGSEFEIVVIAGTPAGSPVLPAVPDSAIPLAQIGPITPSTPSITNSLITDLRGIAGRKCTPGEMVAQANTSAAIPNGWLLCAGQAVSRTTYARLFAHLGTTYGVGDGTTTFNLPDLRGRIPVGLDNMGGSDAARLSVSNTLGGSGGAADATLVAHTHPISDLENASVRFGYRIMDTGGGGTARDVITRETSGSDQIVIDSAGTSATMANMPPYLLVNWIVRT
jgi:microcystin-dependent protein